MRLVEAIYRVEDQRIAGTRFEAIKLDEALKRAVDIAVRDRLNKRGEVMVNVWFVPELEMAEMAFAALARVLVHGKAPYWTAAAAGPVPEITHARLGGS